MPLVERLSRLFVGFGHFFEITFFTASDEAFAIAFEFIPLGADFFGFIPGDGAICRCLGNAGEEAAELGDDFVGGREDLESLLAAAFGVANEVAVIFFAKPLNDFWFFGEADDLKEAVEGVPGSASASRLFLGPFINKRQGNAEFGGDFLRAAVFERYFKDLVRFHLMGNLEKYCADGKLLLRDVDLGAGFDDLGGAE